MVKKLHVHFMGIGGSALSGVALMAKKAGFKVSGCNLEEDTAYIGKVKKSGIEVFKGHDAKHLKGVDILAVSPAVVYLNENHPEYTKAKKLGILRIWDKFVGEYLLKDKESICITGTHGKSTTTSMAALLFENAGLDPSAIIGAKVRKWDNNYRVGKSKYFIIEADDFYDKFLSYKPSTIIVNNIEFDHPDFFRSEEHMIESYYKFVRLLQGTKNLILNQDSVGIKWLFNILEKDFLNSINLYGYTFSDSPTLKIDKSARIEVIKKTEDGTKFKVKSDELDLNNVYYLSIPGEYNIANATGVIILSKLYGIKNSDIQKTLLSFKGVGRRLELIGEKKGIKVYDDYAHHPTAIKVTLDALRQKYPKERIWAVVEPHSYSRTYALLKDYKGVFDEAHKVIIGPIFKARDKKTFGVTGISIVNESEHKDAVYKKDLRDIISVLSKESGRGDIILVMGAGKSYIWAREILNNL
ncbi:UDP-N-acetylmuramate--L-alanine ligase [Candidatus Woesebacteria bacterium RIFCSPHIGHO2_01_FULL_38_9]|uniref:UDP-N-acetylmuramate--L-alanine ligase n=2 Tax=Candidatus Woeseibacteriota TaxID=1752722 RepID=A0A1F7Y2X4_9BACT|nr:MAG: UDP-N-acetylmuramate--L-alanine ligase [Candidatus Woesebacteria bacterium RIFCSPHIGHO2_01_FULL_38_9]OGM58321.1 MAG: UDP-N-acetylmuramate--L-alanine ligase [Candidatus Woesebacteria bacterium RIFCSPLOWO2_01_FULL_39_10]